MPERGNNELSHDPKRPDSSRESSSKLAQEALSDSTPIWQTTAFKQGASEFVGTSVAGLSGVLTFSAGWAIKRNTVLKAASLFIAPAMGGFYKHATKESMDYVLNLKGKNKSACNNDYLTGALDAFAGITGSAAERKVSHWYTGYLGRKELTVGSASAAGGLKHEFVSWLNSKPPTGLVSDKSAIAEGERILAQDVLPQITHNVLRGVAGGYVGSLTWSVPHRIAENKEAFEKDATAGTLKTITDVGMDTALGTIIGGGTAGLITTALNGRYITRYAHAQAVGDEGLTRLDVAYFNDAHSQTIGDRNFARAATKIDDIRQHSAGLDNSTKEGVVCWQDVPEQEKFSRWWQQFVGAEPVMRNGRDHRASKFFQNGDLENANVTAPWTGWGEKEDKIIRAMKADGETWGNHFNDQAGGGVDNGRAAKYIHEENIRSGRQRPITCTNLDYSDLDAETQQLFKAIEKPYILHKIPGPNGKPVKAVTIGVVTEEAAAGGIKYQDPVERLQATIDNIKKEHPDVNIFMVQSHLGDELDRHIAAKVKDVSVVFGAHSHKAFTSPVWINNGERDVAILQAGSYLSHVGEANLAFNPNGSLNRYHTKNRLHAITKDIKEDPVIDAIIKKDMPKELDDLRNTTYDGAIATQKYTLDNVRRGENPTANLIVDALAADSNIHLPAGLRPDIVTAQSGFIRTGLPAGQELSRLDLCKTIINSGKLEDEALEQVLLNVTGKQFKEMLEFGISDLNPSQEPGLRGFIKHMFNRMVTGKSVPYSDDPQGNLLHLNGSYTMDLTKPVGQRVTNIFIKENGQLKPLETDRTYRWQTRWHYVDKAHKAGLFGDTTLKEMYAATNATKYERSIPNAIGDYIRGKQLNPNIDGKIEGRLIDVTPQPFSLQFGPGPSIPTFSLLSARDTMTSDQQAH